MRGFCGSESSRSNRDEWTGGKWLSLNAAVCENNESHGQLNGPVVVVCGGLGLKLTAGRDAPLEQSRCQL